MRVPRAGTLVRASLLLAVLGAAVMLFVPSGTQVTQTASNLGQSGTHVVTTVRHPTLVASEGVWVVWLALVPVLLAAAPLAFERTRLRRGARAVAAVLLGFGVLVGMLSIGIFFLPSAVLMIAAALGRDTAAIPAASATTSAS